MKKQPNILIIGFGSIGKRHYRNLRALGYKDLAVFDVDKQALQGLPRAISDVRTIHFKEYEVVFICSPNHLHMRHALLAANAGCHLFIEKPLSHELHGVHRFAKMCERRKLVTLVGCNMRFHPCLAFIKEYISGGKLGEVFSVHHEFGYYLPYWRKGVNYRSIYAAKKRTGGGIILDDIHEFDLLFWLNDFSKVEESKFLFTKSGKLDIETEDNCVASFAFQNGSLGSVRSDYLQQRYRRTCKVVGEKGNLFWDFNENIVWLETLAQRRCLLRVQNYDSNMMYQDEIAYFLECVAKRKQTSNGVAQAAKVLRYCLERK